MYHKSQIELNRTAGHDKNCWNYDNCDKKLFHLTDAGIIKFIVLQNQYINFNSANFFREYYLNKDF